MQRTTIRSARGAPAVLVLALALLLGACGGDEGGGSGDGSGAGDTNAALDANATITPTAFDEQLVPVEPDEAEGGAGEQGSEGGSGEDASGEEAQGLTITTVANSGAGTHLADSAGRALYVFAGDEQNASTCSGECAELWPPVLIGAGLEPTAGEGVEGTLGRIDRGEGIFQVTYNGQPLYYYSGDQEAGQVTGAAVDEQWSPAAP